MPGNSDRLKANFQPGTQYLVAGELLNELINSIRRNTPIAGRNLNFEEVHNGIILHAEAGGEPAPHQWQATKASATTLDVLGGIFTTQPFSTPLEIAAVTGLSATASGYVILTVNRVSATRELDGTPAITYVDGDPSASTEASQIIRLAKVTVAASAITGIVPLRTESIHVFEDMAVVNGELKYVDLLIAGSNLYDLPSPPPP